MINVQTFTFQWPRSQLRAQHEIQAVCLFFYSPDFRYSHDPF